MFSKNLKYYRLEKNFTKKQLAEECGLSVMAISNYESGKRHPDLPIIKKLAKALNVKVSDFLKVRNAGLVFEHGEIRRNSTLLKHDQDFIRESVEEYFSRFFDIVEILGGEPLVTPPACHQLVLLQNDESNALSLRKYLGFPLNGPVGNLIEAMENRGILIYKIDLENEKFSGMNGFVNNRPYIVLNRSMTDERNRSAMAHELVHLMFSWPRSSSDSKEDEQRASAIAEAFLISESDLKRKLGLKRKQITYDMALVCREYGISMLLLAKRAALANIISENAAKSFYIQASKRGWKKREPSRIAVPETPCLFKQLVYRAVTENEITIQKGAELLQIPYDEVYKECFQGEF